MEVGMPSIIKKRGKLIIRASVTVNKITRQKLFNDDSDESMAAAKCWESVTKSSMLAAVNPFERGYVSVNDWMQAYLTDAKARCVQKTYDEKKSAFSLLIEKAGLTPDMPVDNIVPFANKVLTEKAIETSGNVANKLRKNLSAAWEFGSENDSLKTGWPNCANPFRIKKFKTDASKVYVPPEAHFWRVFECASGQDRVMLLTYYTNAARKSELFRLTWADVRFDNKSSRLGTRKQSGGLRYDWMPLTQNLHKALLEWKQEQKKILGHTPENVFCCLSTLFANKDYYGKPFTSRQHLMENLCDEARVPRFGLHAIRHMVAFKFYKAGKSLAFIQRFLRHKSPTTTVRYLRTLGCEDIHNGVEESLGAEDLRVTVDALLPSGDVELIADGHNSVIDFAAAMQKRKFER
jgi:integrase